MNPTYTDTEDYLLRLTEGIEALGPEETREVLAEIRGHLASACEESPGGETEALARFGPPEALASKIVEERGLLRVDSSLPQVPAWIRWATRAIDAAIRIAVPVAVALVPLAIYLLSPPARTPLALLEPLWLILLWLLIAAAAASTAGWALRQERMRGRTTAGMTALGLRNVRIGVANRLVRDRDIPDAPRHAWRRFRSLAAAGFAMAVIIFLVGALSWSLGGLSHAHQRRDVASAVANANAAVQTVELAYDAVASDPRNADPQSLGFSAGASEALARLVARSESGQIKTYAASISPWMDYSSLVGNYDSTLLQGFEPNDDLPISVTVSVLVSEFPETDPNGIPAEYEYVVKYVVTPHDSGYSARWMIESATQIETSP